MSNKVSEVKTQADAMFCDFVAEVVYRTAARPPMAIRHVTDANVQEFLKIANEAEPSKIGERLFDNILRIADPKAAQAICRQLMATATFWYLGEHNRQTQKEELLARMGITDERGVADAEKVFGQYNGYGAQDPGDAEQLPVELPVLAACIDQLYVALAACYADAVPQSSVRRTAFNNRAADVLAYASRRTPLGEYASWYTLSDAVEGLTRLREAQNEFEMRATMHSRQQRGDIQF
jgi:hypothetical protein